MGVAQIRFYNQWNNRGYNIRTSERVGGWLRDCGVKFDLIRFSFKKRVCSIGRLQYLDISLFGFNVYIAFYLKRRGRIWN